MASRLWRQFFSVGLDRLKSTFLILELSGESEAPVALATRVRAIKNLLNITRISKKSLFKMFLSVLNV